MILCEYSRRRAVARLGSRLRNSIGQVACLHNADAAVLICMVVVLLHLLLLPRRVCCAQRSARLGQHAQAPEQAQGDTAPTKNSCDKQVSSWRHISCHTDKNRYYT